LGARRVILTDGDTDTLVLLRANVATNVSVSNNNNNDNTVECRQLRWGQEFVSRFLCSTQECFGFDIILASDVIYVEDIIEPLLDTVVALLAPNGVFWLSYVRRNVSIEKVLRSAERHGLSWREPSSSSNEAAVEGVYVFFMTTTTTTTCEC
jgi:predicted nicotinamide N-methyase